MNKNYFYSLLLLACVTFFSCSEDEPEIILEGDKLLKVEQNSLEFSYYGGVQTLKIESENLDNWEAYASISWIKLGEPNTENGTITVTVDPTDSTRDMSGYIVLYSDGTEDQKIPVIQKGLGIIHDRSSRERLNLKGNIESVEYLIDFVHHWDRNKWILKDVTFNEAGNVTAYELNLSQGGFVQEYYVEVKYDGQERISIISVTTNMHIEETGAPFEWTMEMDYGNHGYYLVSTSIFDAIQGFNCYGLYEMWAPQMIKDLIKVKFKSSNLLGADGFDFDFEFDGNSAIGYMVVEGSGSDPYFTYTFENNFTKSVSTYNYEFGFPLMAVTTYEVNPENGNLLSQQIELDMFGEVASKTYNDDRYNTLATYEEYLEYGYEMTIQYNDKYNVSNIYNGYTGVSGTLEYKYDAMGNWIEASIDGDSYSRNIQYRD